MTAIISLTAMLRQLVKWFYIGCAITVICLALFVQAGRSFFHLLGEYPQQISHYLSQQFKANVSIGALATEWNGLKPTVDVEQLRISSQSGQPIIALAHAHLQLDLLDSLLNLRLVWSSLTLRQTKVDFVQSVDGRWRVPGLPRLEDKNPDEELAQLDTLIDMLLLSRHIEFEQTDFNFQFASGDKTLLQSPLVLMENVKDFHRLSLQVDVDKQPKTVQLVIEAKGDPRHKKNFICNAYLKLNQFPTNEPIAVVTALLLHGINAEVHSEGTLNASFWFNTLPQREGFNVVGQVDVARLSVPIFDRKLALDSFSTEVVGTWLYSGKWQLAAQNIGASINQHKIEKVNLAVSAETFTAPVVMHMQSLNLQRLNQALAGAGVFGEARLRNVMRQLEPSGELRNIEVSIPTKKLSDWQLRANLVQVASHAWQGVPALTQVDGFVQVGQRGGHVDIDSQAGFSMFYSPTYAAPMVYDRAKGQVAWWLQPENNQIYVNSGALEFVSGNEKAKGYMWLALPWKYGTGDVDLYLHVGATQLNASLYRKYTPAVVPDSLLTWLHNSIGEQNTGTAEQAGFVYRGTLNTPKQSARSHQLYLDVSHAQLHYHPEWPSLEDISGRLLVDDVNVTANVDTAKFFASDVSATQISVRRNTLGEGTLLRVDGQVSGTASDGLRVLRESMLRQYVGANMDSWKLEGEMRTNVSIAVPLQANAPGATQQIDIDLQAPFFAMSNLNLRLRDLDGHIAYNQESGLTSQHLQGKLFDEPVAARISTKKFADFSQTVVDVNGELDSHTLAHWSQRPEALYLNGKIPYHAQVQLNHHPKHKTLQTINPQAPFAVVTVTSQLAGVAVNLPEPYAKARDLERPLIFKLSLSEKSSLIDVNYGGNVQTLFEVDPRNNNKLLNANVALGGMARLATDEPQFLLSGVLPTLDIEKWKSAIQQYFDYVQQLELDNPKRVLVNAPAPAFAPTLAPAPVPSAADTLVAGLPFRANVLLEHYQVGPLPLEKIEVRAERLLDSWKVQFVNPVVVGEIYLPNEKIKPLQINLQTLRLTQSLLAVQPVTGSGDLQADINRSIAIAVPQPSLDPHTLPLANVTVKALYIDDNNYGHWSLQVRPNEQGVLFDNIHGAVRGITISGADDALAGAKLRWTFDENGPKTHFIGALSATDISSVLQQWHKPDTIESSAVQVRADLHWVGDPQDFELKKIAGNMTVALEKGRFKRNPSVGSDGFLRLMAILNFDSLARRLRLDFSDLYQSGLAYDQISGKVNFEPGTMTFAEPLVVKTPSSRLQMAGKLDLEHEKINARLVATLPIAGNFTFFTALVMGLPAAAGIYVVSKLFKKQVDQATSISYNIQGSWDDPKMTFDRLFESEESLRDSVNQTAAPKKTQRLKNSKSRAKK